MRGRTGTSASGSFPRWPTGPGADPTQLILLFSTTAACCWKARSPTLAGAPCMQPLVVCSKCQASVVSLGPSVLGEAMRCDVLAPPSFQAHLLDWLLSSRVAPYCSTRQPFMCEQAAFTSHSLQSSPRPAPPGRSRRGALLQSPGGGFPGQALCLMTFQTQNKEAQAPLEQRERDQM